MAPRDRPAIWSDLRGLPAASSRRHAKDPLICLCNRVPLSAIDAAMDAGADSLAKLFDATFAGCGPCGGSCQPELQRLLQLRHAAAQPDEDP